MAIVVSHIANDFDTLSKQVLRQARLADVVELRLDRTRNPGEDRLRALIRELGKPCIVAVHGPEAHGHFPGGDGERLEILRSAARAGATFVDVDWRLSLELGEVGGKCHRIVSRHELSGTPGNLAEFREEVEAVLYEGDLIKLVTHANCTEDGLRMLSYVRSCKGLIGFCSGEKGTFTRVLAPIFGSPFTYAAPANVPDMPLSELAAPGQLRVNELRGLLPPGGATSETAVFGVVGKPIHWSWSPILHGMALKGARLDAVYVALEPESLPALLELAQCENFRGFSVTSPFKERAFELAHSRDKVSEIVRASNTLVRDAQGWQARNTDVPAVRETLEAALAIHGQRLRRPFVLQGVSALVLGTGGAARACVRACIEAGARPTVAGRNAEKAAAVAAQIGGRPAPWSEIPSIAYDVLLHTTPLGSRASIERGEDAMPVPEEWIRPETLVLDAVYRPVKTALLAAALRKNCTAVPGGEWFVRQAAGQFKAFTHVDAKDALLRAAFDSAVRADQSSSFAPAAGPR